MTEARTNPTSEPVLDVVRRRWSPVAYDGTPVGRPALRRIFEAARWAASSFNEQPWRFVLGPGDDREQFDRVLSTLVEANREWAQHAGALVLVCAKQSFTHNGKPNRHAGFDTGQALAHVFLQTVELGLHAHAMGGFDRDVARATFGIDDDFEPMCVVAIGHHAPQPALSEDAAARDRKPRVRRPLGELVFGARFGETSDVVAD